MQRRAIIHIGMPKTGSTSIQQRLYSNLDDPAFEYISLEDAKDCNHIFSLFTKTPEDYHFHKRLAHTPAQIEAFNLKIKQLLINRFKNSQAPNIIISAETITSIKKLELQELKQFLYEFFNEVIIVGYIRPPRSFMESSFQQTVKGPNIALNIAQVYPNYRLKFERFDHVFGREQVHLWKFDPENFLQGDVVLDFCQRLGIKISSKTLTKRDNKSLPKQAIQLLFTYRKFYPYEKGAKAAKEYNRLIQAIRTIGDKKLRFSPSMLETIFTDRKDDILWMEQRLGTSLIENMVSGDDDINSEHELLHIDLTTLEKLKDLLGKEYLPDYIDGNTPEQAAYLMHRLQCKLIEKPNIEQKYKINLLNKKKYTEKKELNIEILKNSLITPIKAVKKSVGEYPLTAKLIGGIYTDEGQVHTKSLLKRSYGQIQFPENDYIPTIQEENIQVKRGVYGGIIDNQYGHFLLETLSRVWALNEYPEEDVYFHLTPSQNFKSFSDLKSWQQALLKAALVNAKRLHFITETIHFDELIVPEAGYVIQNYCSKTQAQALTGIGHKIKIKAKTKPEPITAKIWLSRSLLKKGAIAGEKEFEEALKKEGFSIIHPELLSLAEQIISFEKASVIAGITGSAFHTLLLANNKHTKLLHFERNQHVNKNYETCAQAKGFKAEYYNFFEKYGVLKNANASNANVIQNFSKIWETLHAQGLTKAKNYTDPYLELKLQKLDEETEKLKPNLFKENITMNGKANNANIDRQNTTLAPSPVITHSARRINKLAKEIDLHNYLEIGVNKGQTFFNVSIPQKTAVDPKFLFDMSTVTDKNITLKQTVSDGFFSTLPIMLKYDAIFIDGLHTFEQTYRDLCNSLLHSHERTILLIDDTKPSDVYSAFPQQGKAVRYRKQAGGQGGAWHGDVYKIVFALHDFHPGLNYRTIIGSGNPQTLVWRSTSGWREPLFNSFEQISRLTYFDLLDNIDILRSCSEEEAIRLCLNELASQ